MLKNKMTSFLPSHARFRPRLTKGIFAALGVAILTSSLLLVAPASAQAQDRGHTTTVRTQPLHTPGVFREDIFGVSSSGSLTHRVYQNGTVSAQEDLGGTVISDPAAVAWTSSSTPPASRDGSRTKISRPSTQPCSTRS